MDQELSMIMDLVDRLKEHITDKEYLDFWDNCSKIKTRLEINYEDKIMNLEDCIDFHQKNNKKQHYEIQFLKQDLAMEIEYIKRLREKNEKLLKELKDNVEAHCLY